MNERVRQITEALNAIDCGDRLQAGTLISSMLEARFRKGEGLFKSVLRSFYHLSGAKRGATHLYVTKPGYQEKSNRPVVLIGLSSNSDRLYDFFKDLVRIDEKFDFLIICEKPFTHLHLQQMISFKKHHDYRRIFWAVLKMKDLSSVEKLLCLACLKLQLPKYGAYKEFFKKHSIPLMIADHDCNPNMIPLVLAGQLKRVKTATLVHGSISPIDHYLPVVADRLWVWGTYHLEKFVQGGVPLNKIRIVGNSKLPPVKKSVARGKRVIGLGTSPLSDSQFSRLFGLLEQLDFKPILLRKHPLTRPQVFADVSDLVRVQPANESLSTFFNKLSVLLVERSQIGSDALLYGIPVVVINVVGFENLQNGLLINAEAGCPIIDNASDLNDELHRLHEDMEYRNKRIQKQNIFLSRLYACHGAETTKRMIAEIEKETKV